MTPRLEPKAPRAPAVDPGWLKLDFTGRSAAPRPVPPRPPSGLREAILRWLEEEL